MYSQVDIISASPALSALSCEFCFTTFKSELIYQHNFCHTHMHRPVDHCIIRFHYSVIKSSLHISVKNIYSRPQYCRIKRCCCQKFRNCNSPDTLPRLRELAWLSTSLPITKIIVAKVIYNFLFFSAIKSTLT